MKPFSNKSPHARILRSKPPSSQSWLGRYSNSWYPESAALLLSSACTVATAIILGYYNGKIPPRVAGVTLNALIATLGTASKALLIFAVSNSLGQLKWVWLSGQTPKSLLDAGIFDDASRGPLGAFRMLFAETRRSAASFGALLIIPALAFDPFIQLVIDYETTTRFSDSNEAAINRAGLFQVDPGASSSINAINSAFWRDDFVWQASRCSTASCQWDNLTTLAWEHKCYEDKNWTLASTSCNLLVTADEAIESSETLFRDCSVSKLFPHSSKAFALDKQISLSFFPLSGDFDSNSSVIMTLGLPRAFSIVTYLPQSAWKTYFGINETYPDPTDTSSPFIVVNTFEFRVGPDWKIVLGTITCELDLFVHTYTLKSTGTSVSTSLKQRQPLSKSIVYARNQTSGGQSWICLKADSVSNDSWFSGRAQELPNAERGSISHNLSNDTQYCMEERLTGWGATLGVIQGERNLSGNFEGQVADNTTSDNVIHDWLGLEPSAFPIDDDAAVSTSDAFDVWVDHGPERVMNNIAASMTKLGLDPSLNVNGTDLIYGQIGEVVSLVKVRWTWLILPYRLCAAGIFFFLLTVYLSSQAGAPLWKSSINALFYHGIGHEHGTFEQLSTISEMDDQAAGTKVLLRPCGISKKLMLETTVERR